MASRRSAIGKPNAKRRSSRPPSVSVCGPVMRMVAHDKGILALVVRQIQRMKSKLLVALLFLSPIVALVYYFYQPIWQFDHFEQKAKNAITAAELHSWGTKVLARYPLNTTLRPSDLGVGFPRQLTTLAPRLHPWIHTYEGYEACGTNVPPFVRVAWGSGMLGTVGFDIGPTNLSSPAALHTWQPGVHFIKM